jgi:group I intron endonuclease
MKRSVIYKITSPTGRYYIGKTVNFHARMLAYKNNRNNQQLLIHASIIKYGWENHTVEILEEAAPEKLNELEIKYIQQHNSFSEDNPLGMNLTRGGDGAVGRKDTEETKRKRAQKHVGLKRSSETRKLMSERKKGKIPFASTLPRSEKQLYHSRYGNVGKKRSSEALKKEYETKLKKFLDKFGGILQIDLEGNIVKEWHMLPKHVAKEIGLDDSYFLSVLKKREKPVKGFFWKFKTRPECQNSLPVTA